MVARLRAAGCVFAEDEAALLIEATPDPADLERLISRRARGEPLEQVLGWAAFCGLRIGVEPGVFVPRRRTELMVAEAARRSPPDAIVLDLCCGSGAVAAALRHQRPDLDLHAADLDPGCVRCARRNLGPAVPVYAGDLFEALPARLRGRIAVIAANTPYVPTSAIALMPPEARDHEPPLALDGGPDGLDLQRRVARDAPHWLAPGGHLLVETSKRQAPVTAAFFAAAGLTPQISHDDDRDATLVSGTWPTG